MSTQDCPHISEYGAPDFLSNSFLFKEKFAKERKHADRKTNTYAIFTFVQNLVETLISLEGLADSQQLSQDLLWLSLPSWHLKKVKPKRTENVVQKNTLSLTGNSVSDQTKINERKFVEGKKEEGKHLDTAFCLRKHQAGFCGRNRSTVPQIELFYFLPVTFCLPDNKMTYSRDFLKMANAIATALHSARSSASDTLLLSFLKQLWNKKNQRLLPWGLSRGSLTMFVSLAATVMQQKDDWDALDEKSVSDLVEVITSPQQRDVTAHGWTMFLSWQADSNDCHIVFLFDALGSYPSFLSL